MDKKNPVNIQRFSPDPNIGLSSEEAEFRFKNGASNKVTENASQSIGSIIFSNIFTYFNLIFVCLAALLIIVGAYRGLTFLPVIIANTLIGIVQQIRSKKTLDKLNMMNAPTAHIIRSGKAIYLPPEKAVLDDISVFKSGSQVYADAVIVSGSVKVNESLLTGESDEITRAPGDTLMSGSFIISGECRARLDKVGDSSYIAQLSAKVKTKDKREHSKMMSALNTIIKFVGAAIIPIGLIMFSQQYFIEKSGAYSAVSTTVAALLGMIPEGLYLLASAALALSVMRLGKHKVNVHDMSCVETLARVDVICVDKTGTITENTMSVKSAVPLSGINEDELHSLIGSFSSAMSTDNITMEAVKKYFNKYADLTPEMVIPFSSKNKYSAAVIKNRSYVMGAPELVLRDEYFKYEERIEYYTKKGFRVLVFAKYSGNTFSGPLTEQTKALGLIILCNPVRKKAAATFKYFYRQGVDIKVISGDNPITVSEAAKEAKIHGAENYIDASNLTNTEEILEAVKKYTVFGRVTPEMKCSMIKALQSLGKTAAMVGDGVNDIIALKEADCSIAMASGSEAASHIAQIVLMESDFSRLPGVLLEGRRVVNNIERSAGLFLIKNIFSFLLAVFSMLTAFKYPLHPSQVTLINMFTIGTPGFLLALENNKSLIKGSFISNVLKKALPAALTDFIAICILVSYGNIHGLDSSVISTVTVYVVAAVGFFVLIGITRPYNKFRIAVIALMLIGFILSVCFLEWIFMLSQPTFKIVLLAAVFSAASAVLLAFLTKMFNAAYEKFSLIRRRMQKDK